MDPISISAIVISIISALGVILARLKFKHCHCGCIDSDCINTPPNTPLDTPNHAKTNEGDDIYVSDYL